MSDLTASIISSAPLAGLGFLPDLNTLLLVRWPLIAIGVVLLIRLLFPRSKTTAWQFVSELLIIIPAFLAYFLVRKVVEGRVSEAFSNGAKVIELERAVGIFWEPRLQEHILDFDLLVNLANWVYMWGHWPVIVLAAVWLFLMHRDAYHVYRNAFLISGAIGLIIFAAFPVAPPRFMEAWGFVDTVAENSSGYRVLQPPAFVNQYAAMPSLHFGWNLLVGVAIARYGSVPLLRLFGALMPAAMFVGIVLTANHYIIDGLAGGGLALLGLVTAIMLRRLYERGREADTGNLPGLAAPS